jgi:hypothetical protein
MDERSERSVGRSLKTSIDWSSVRTLVRVPALLSVNSMLVPRDPPILLLFGVDGGDQALFRMGDGDFGFSECCI